MKDEYSLNLNYQRGRVLRAALIEYCHRYQVGENLQIAYELLGEIELQTNSLKQAALNLYPQHDEDGTSIR